MIPARTPRPFLPLLLLLRLPLLVSLVCLFAIVIPTLSPSHSLVTAYEGGPTLFCKCTCGTNYTLIPLGERPDPPPSMLVLEREFDMLRRPREDDSNSGSSEGSGNDNNDDDDSGNGNGKGKPPTVPTVPTGVKNSCSNCNRQTCLSYELPICKGIKNEEEVVTTCFQRDSKKDQAVVYIFILATAVLLGYAIARPWVGGWLDAWKERRSYTALSGGL